MKSPNYKILNLIRLFLKHHFVQFLIIYLFSLIIVILFFSQYEKLGILFAIMLVNLNSLTYPKLWSKKNFIKRKHQEYICEKQSYNQLTSFEWLQTIIDQIWPGELVVRFQKELNKFYIKNRSTRYKFYHFYLNENSPPKIEQLYMPLESTRQDEIVMYLRVTISGTVLLKLNEDNKNKDDLLFINELISKFGFKRKFQVGKYQDASLKKKNFLSKEFCLNCRSRITLRSLINCVPFFTSLFFTFIDYPLMYSNDKLDHYESYDEFESKFYNYLIEQICLPFLHPNCLILKYAHYFYLRQEHTRIFQKKLYEADQSIQNKLIRLIVNKRKLDDFVNELNDSKIINWYQRNIMKNINIVEMKLNNSTFHPFPLFIFRIKIIEFENIISNCVLFIRIIIGKFSTSKIRLINVKSPILNLTALLPVHDYYEQCIIQLIQIKSFKIAQIKKFTNELNNNLRMFYDSPFIKPIGEITFPIDKKTFDCGDEENYSLNGQDFWLPFEGIQSSMIHLCCTCFKLSSTYKTIQEVYKTTTSLMLTKSDLINNLFPTAFIVIYVENFICTYSKENKLKSRLDQFNRLQLTFFGQTKQIDLMKISKKKLIFRESCHFFLYDDPFNNDIIIELLNKDKDHLTLEANQDEENRIRLLNMINLNDYKGKIEQSNNKMLSIFIINNKEFTNAYLKKENTDFKLVDRDEYGKLNLNLFIRFVSLDRDILEKNLFAPSIRGYNLENKKRLITKTTKQDLENLLKFDKKKKLKTDECVCKLYFKLIDSTLEVGILEVLNVPYDNTKSIKLQVIIELWKGNYKVSMNKTKFTDIVHNPTFDSAFLFAIESGNLQQYAIRLVVIQRSGFFKSVLKILADRFCTIPLLTLDVNFIIRYYTLKSTKKRSTNINKF